MAKLTDFKLLSFDVYGTIIDWERGVLNALQPLLEKNGKVRTQLNCPNHMHHESLKFTVLNICSVYMYQY